MFFVMVFIYSNLCLDVLQKALAPMFLEEAAGKGDAHLDLEDFFILLGNFESNYLIFFSKII